MMRRPSGCRVFVFLLYNFKKSKVIELSWAENLDDENVDSLVWVSCHLLPFSSITFLPLICL